MLQAIMVYILIEFHRRTPFCL